MHDGTIAAAAVGAVAITVAAAPTTKSGEMWFSLIRMMAFLLSPE
jgi:hypothetical protein